MSPLTIFGYVVVAAVWLWIIGLGIAALKGIFRDGDA